MAGHTDAMGDTDRNRRAAKHDDVPPEQLSHYEGLFRPAAAGRGGQQPYDAPTAAQAPPLAPAGPAAPPAKRTWGWKRVVLVIIAVLLVYMLALATVFALSVNKISAMPAIQIPQTQGTNYLLVGSDSRGDISAKERSQLHLGSVEGQRTDTIMLLHVPLLGTPTLISIPRDSWVPIPGHGEDKINAAYALGGPQLLIQTVENTTGVHIDNYVEIGMVGIARITDTLGGLELCPDRKYNDEKSGLNVKKGCQEMDGKTALAYVRMRYSDPKGDLGRAERQQEYMKAVATKTINPLTWLNPFKMFAMSSTAGDSLTVDDGTGIVDDSRMAVAMGMLAMGWGESTTVPTLKDTYFVNGQAALKWDTPKALELFASIGGA